MSAPSDCVDLPQPSRVEAKDAPKLPLSYRNFRRGIDLALTVPVELDSTGSREGVIQAGSRRAEIGRECGTMEWRLDFWRRREKTGLAGNPVPSRQGEPEQLEEWEARLTDEGVSAEWAPRLARRLASIDRDEDSGADHLLIRGAVAAVELQAEAHADVERNMSDVKEVERLLGAFSGELEKLDEVLEVLAAYAQRMRAKPANSSNSSNSGKKPRHTLH
jgi:hypothetical protein